MFVRLVGRLYKIEFASSVGAVLVQCIKCEGFLLSFFSLCVSLSLYLYDNLTGMLSRQDSH